MALKQSDLDQFAGGSDTVFSHQLLTKFRYTCGVQHMAVEGGAYWLIDKIISLQLKPEIAAEVFQSWKLTVTANTGLLLCDDGDGKVVYREEIGFTDFPLPKIKLWMVGFTLMLPCEY